MSRATIDFGIDLGTTNSAIAVTSGTQVHVFRNNFREEFTPSAIWIDKNDNLHVGQHARQRGSFDPANAAFKFKRQMGLDVVKRFERSGREMHPEELSAEVLKSLKQTVQVESGEDVQTAVITVPAEFDLASCEATRKAAEYAGFMDSPLLQEPVAAAMAYGFQRHEDGVFWLVYDFGGGTFDAAVIQVRDRMIEVINHGGNDKLGGSDIDAAIMNKLLVPMLSEHYNLAEFPNHPRWTAARALLPLKAEEAKILLSRARSTEIYIENLGLDADGTPMRDIELPLTVDEVVNLAEPFIRKTINISKGVLREKRLEPGHIEKILLVGGPTLAPYLRDMLADESVGLGIPLEFSVDPITVVAQGAARYAGSQPLPRADDDKAVVRPRPAAEFRVTFADWKTNGSDLEPLVAGRIEVPEGISLEAYSIELVNTTVRPPWNSGKIPLVANGAFMTTLWVEEGITSAFEVCLYNRAGNLQPVVTVPEALEYTVSMELVELPLTHNVGVALVQDEVLWFFKKNDPLPARRREPLKTAYPVRSGHDGDVLRIPVVEGQHPRASRNRRVGKIEVTASQVRRDLPVGSDVEVMIEIDKSRLVRVKAFVPLLDEEFEAVWEGTREQRDIDSLRDEAENEFERIEQLRQTARSVDAPQAQRAIEQLDAENQEGEIRDVLQIVEADEEAADKCNRLLLDLGAAVDEIEDDLEWPVLVNDAQAMLEAANGDIGRFGNENDKHILRSIEADIQNAIELHDRDLVQQRVEELRMLVFAVLDREGILPRIYFEQLKQHKNEMRDPAQADYLIREGIIAQQANDVDRLREINPQLVALLETPPPEPDMGTLTRF